ncbi:MAG: hypothetical protein IIB44_08075, partial [Candidatus Marinimicrobia bacterium]|nr:hypothetical protein [Candidatus Neomarinimicrobiota bacterium]
PCEDVTGGVYGKRPDIKIRQAVIYLRPAVTIVGGAKDTAGPSPGEDVTGGIYGKRTDMTTERTVGLLPEVLGKGYLSRVGQNHGRDD